MNGKCSCSILFVCSASPTPPRERCHRCGGRQRGTGACFLVFRHTINHRPNFAPSKILHYLPILVLCCVLGPERAF